MRWRYCPGASGVWGKKKSKITYFEKAYWVKSTLIYLSPSQLKTVRVEWKKVYSALYSVVGTEMRCAKSVVQSLVMTLP